MCDISKFALSQFDKSTPYYKNSLETSYYFSFCKQADLNPCDGLICTTKDGIHFDSLGKSLSLEESSNQIHFRDGACDNSNNGHSDVIMLCGDPEFKVLESDRCYLKAEYQHPYMCPRLKSTCGVAYQGYEFKIEPFEFVLDDHKYKFNCVDDYKKANEKDCNGAAICYDDKYALDSPFLRSISSGGVGYRFYRGSSQYEIHLNCDNNGEKVTEIYQPFKGGPKVHKLTLNNGTCPTVVYTGSIIGYVILGM
eukprot:NODE_200_length_15202_cov_0.356618.p7 type:complete len:252 gc:universal NODE_200_length_15202_cov_0.356618:12540-11785(-)